MADTSGRLRIAVRIGVDIPDHERLLRIERGVPRTLALGVWLVANCRTRGKEKSGWCAVEWLEPHATVEVVAGLVEAGLFAYEDQDGVHGVRVLRYEEFNETKEEIDERLRRDRLRAKGNRRKGKLLATSGGRPADVLATSGGTLGDGEGTGIGEGTSGSLSRLGGDLEQNGGPPLTLVPLGEPSPPRDELAAVFDEWVSRRAVRILGPERAAARNRTNDPVFSVERRKLLAQRAKVCSLEKLRYAVRGLVADNTPLRDGKPKGTEIKALTWMLEDQDQLDAYAEAGAAAAERERERRAARAATNGAAPHEAPSGVVAVAPVADEPKAVGGAA
jgi:hypothetical protein